MIYSDVVFYVLNECELKDKNEDIVYLKLFILSFLIAGILFIPLLFFKAYPITGYILIGLFYLLIYFIVFGAFFIYRLMRTQQSVRLIVGLIDSLKNCDWLWAKEALVEFPIKIDVNIIRHPSAMFVIGMVFFHSGKIEEGNKLIELAISYDPYLKRFDRSASLCARDALYLKESIMNMEHLRLMHSLKKIWTIRLVRYLIISSILFLFFLHFLITFSKFF